MDSFVNCIPSEIRDESSKWGWCFLFLQRSPARSLGFTILGEIFAYLNVFVVVFFLNPVMG